MHLRLAAFSLALSLLAPAPLPAADPPSSAAAPPVSSSAPPPAAEPPAPRVEKPLTSKERKELTRALPDRYRNFLDDVEPILFDEERDVFLRLKTDALRDRFVDLFWRRRNQIPGGRNDYRSTFYERLAIVRDRYSGTTSDPGRILILQGEPDEVKKTGCEDVFVPMEIWIYSRLPSWRRGATLIFYRPMGLGTLRLWTPTDGVSVLYQPGKVDPWSCGDGGYMSRLLRSLRSGSSAGAAVEYAQLYEKPKVPLEGLESILASSTELPKGAKRIAFGQIVRFPRREGNRIATEVTVLIAKNALAERALGDSKFAATELVGEIVVPAGATSDERLADSFRYRFDLPLDGAAPPVLPMIAERLLRPGLYEMRTKLLDANRNAAGSADIPLLVPDRPEGVEEQAREESRELIEKLAAAPAAERLPSAGAPVAIAPIAGEARVGLVKVEVDTLPGVAAVEFQVDGKKIGIRRAPPFELDADLGPLPRPRQIRVVGLDAKGAPLGSDEVVVNESPDAFRIRIARPAKGEKVSGPTRVETVLTIPEGRKPAKVELLVDDKLATTLFGPPWVGAVRVESSDRPSTIRAAATLDDGQVAEDFRFVNAPAYLEEVEVERVELFVSATDKGRLVSGLEAKDFRLLVGGKPVAIDGFEVVHQLPLQVVLALDTSESMRESLPETEKAAAGFLRGVLRPQDRAALVRFDDEPRIVQRFTGERPRLESALASLTAERGTALWDATVYSLFQFQGKKGRRALVLLSDGKDVDSRFSYADALDYAKRSGATIYTVALAIPKTSIDVRSKLSELATETGGRSYFIEKASELEGTYARIDEELRTQYRISFAPPGEKDSRWHKVVVELPNRSGVEVRAASGYYR